MQWTEPVSGLQANGFEIQEHHYLYYKRHRKGYRIPGALLLLSRGDCDSCTSRHECDTFKPCKKCSGSGTKSQWQGTMFDPNTGAVLEQEPSVAVKKMLTTLRTPGLNRILSLFTGKSNLSPGRPPSRPMTSGRIIRSYTSSLKKDRNNRIFDHSMGDPYCLQCSRLAPCIDL